MAKLIGELLFVMVSALMKLGKLVITEGRGLAGYEGSRAYDEDCRGAPPRARRICSLSDSDRAVVLLTLRIIQAPCIDGFADVTQSESRAQFLCAVPLQLPNSISGEPP